MAYLLLFLCHQRLEVSVGIFDVTNAHLVSFSRDRDLHPVVLANCNYSLECGKGTCIEYDFKTMEKQVEERFIEGRPRLNFQVSSFFIHDWRGLRWRPGLAK